ncbi:MAG: nuclear transport factor 2 family protein [Pseudomonadota bacterium]
MAKDDRLRIAVLLTAVFLAAFGLWGPASAEPAALDREATRELVQRFLKSWETNDAATFADLLHDDIEFAYPGDRLDKAALLATFHAYQQEKEDIRIYFWDRFFVDADRFATAYQFAATDRDTGLRQAVGTGVIGRIEAGKIVLFKEYYDEQVAIDQYAGKLPLDEGRVSPWPASIWLRPETID